MTSDSDPNSPQEDALPPRSRPSLENLNRDSNELDLWDLDGDAALRASRPASFNVVPREGVAADPEIEEAPIAAPEANPESKRRIYRPQPGAVGPPQPTSDDDAAFADFDELPPSARARAAREKALAARENALGSDLAAGETGSTHPEQPLEDVAADVEDASEAETEPAVVPNLERALPWSPRRSLAGWSATEKFAMIGLTVLLLAGGFWFFANSVSKLPREIELTDAGDFPIQGKGVEVESAHTFWRVPIVAGDNQDIVRRDTAVIPVLRLKATNRSGEVALRVFFVDERGEIIGDAVTKMVGGADELEFAASAGFEDLGMHAAYRTGESKPWSVRVFEGPGINASANAYQKLFEFPVSSLMH